MAEKVQFHAWWRSGLSALIDTEADDSDPPRARAKVRTDLELHHTTVDAGSRVAATETLTAWLAGPTDVAGLNPRSVAHRYPAPGTSDAETSSLAYVEFRDPELPWRYTPKANPDPNSSTPLRPWLCLVVGPENDLSVTGDRITLDQDTQVAHMLADAAKWCHVQQADGTILARLLSPRQMIGGTTYVAALVPTYLSDDNGGLIDAWPASPEADEHGPVTLPCYHHWRFTTGDGGDFRSLALRLTPHSADALGRIPTNYPRLPEKPSFEVHGALTSPGTDTPVDPAIIADVDGLRTPAYDDDGRPIVGLPRYGGTWAEVESTVWGNELNSDPRHRGIAGLGAEVAAAAEEELLAEVSRQSGALLAADQHVRNTALGIMATSRLWDRRLPEDSAHQLGLFGPGLRRVMTESGSLAALATGSDRPLTSSTFSTAARRASRKGPARTALARPEANDPRHMFEAASRCPEPRSPDPGLVPPLGKLGPEEFADRLHQALNESSDVNPNRFDPLFARLRIPPEDENGDPLSKLQTVLKDRSSAGQPIPLTRLVMLAISAHNSQQGPKELRESINRAIKILLDRIDQSSDDPESLHAFVKLAVTPSPPPRPCKPVTPESLAAAARAGFDPRREDSLALRRLFSRVNGLDPDQPLTPPELCPGLDVSVWKYVNEHRPSWLLPGLKDAPADAVLAVESDAVFTAAFLAGFNGALVERLRWNNLRIASKCTPVRTFWNRVDDTGDEPQRLDDIRSISAWPASASLGAVETSPPGVGDSDLVLVLSGQLLLRYPKTVAYLIAAADDGGMDESAPAVFPGFQGRIGDNAVFLGFPGLSTDDLDGLLLVLEEAPSGFRFDAVAPPEADDGARVADTLLAHPIRVLIPGDKLRPKDAT